jgi:hypothetical protein
VIFFISSIFLSRSDIYLRYNASFFCYSLEELEITFEDNEMISEEEEEEEEVKEDPNPAWMRRRSQTYIVDVQGFQYRSSPFIPKELSVVSCETGEVVFHRKIFPPIPYELVGPDFQAQIRWTTQRLHGMHWDDGTTPYLSFGTDLGHFFLDAKYIIVKGRMKKDIISKFAPLADVIDAEGYMCPSLREIVKTCRPENVNPCNGHIYGGDHYSLIY